MLLSQVDLSLMAAMLLLSFFLVEQPAATVLPVNPGATVEHEFNLVLDGLVIVAILLHLPSSRAW